MRIHRVWGAIVLLGCGGGGSSDPGGSGGDPGPVEVPYTLPEIGPYGHDDHAMPQDLGPAREDLFGPEEDARIGETTGADDAASNEDSGGDLETAHETLDTVDLDRLDSSEPEILVECSGQGSACADDGIPCTLDLCDGGVCTHPLKPAYCLIAKRCYGDKEISLGNPCEYCDAGANPYAWSPATGWKCNDGDLCTDPDLCENGVCVSGPNQCVPKNCTYHSDCYPERVCGVWYLDGQAHCSVPCTGPADCGSGEVCTHLPGSAAVGYCQKSPVPAGQGFGGNCTVGADCTSTLCVSGLCGHFCAGESACPSGTCFPAGDGVTIAAGACAPDQVFPTGLPFDWSCTKDAGKTFDSALCLSGHCDLMAASPTCARLCWTDTQCAKGQECNVVLYSSQPVPEATAFHPDFTEKTHDAVLGCYSVGTGGFLGVGQGCQKASDCKTNKCFALTPGDDTKSCTTFCGSDAECPPNMQCKPELLSLTDLWLEQPFSQPPFPSAYTLVRLCKWK